MLHVDTELAKGIPSSKLFSCQCWAQFLNGCDESTVKLPLLMTAFRSCQLKQPLFCALGIDTKLDDRILRCGATDCRNQLHNALLLLLCADGNDVQVMVFGISAAA